MATATANGVRLSYEVSGTGEIPLVMVHGSWLSRRNWDPMIPQSAESFRVLTYDRRGHGESERPSGQGSVREDVADLAALIEHLGLAPAWVAGQSFGGSITLRLAAERPDLLLGITAHEPPLFSLVLWTELPPAIRQMMIEHAPTYLDETNDPDQIAFDLEWIRGFPRPALLTQGIRVRPRSHRSSPSSPRRCPPRK